MLMLQVAPPHRDKTESCCSEVLEDSQLSCWNSIGVTKRKVLTSGKLGKVTAGGLAQAAHMELTLALVTQDHGAVTERP